MSTMTIETKITHKYLMGKRKDDLATMILNMLDQTEAFYRTGAGVIAEERRRQVEGEGWTAEHDDHWTAGELVAAAICYAARWALEKITSDLTDTLIVRSLWPWDSCWWKPKGAIRDLKRAGALLAADIDRRRRAGEKDDGG